MESQIKKQTEKYWEGNTSAEEERILKKDFQNHSSKSVESMFFAELKKRKAVGSSKNFTNPQTKTTILWQISAAAAMIIVLVALAIGFYSETENTNTYTINDPQEAYDISRQALMLVSSNLNKGKTYTKKIDKINVIKYNINK